MKRILFLLVVIGCSYNDIDPLTLLGRWKRIESLADPGDGSGTYQPVNGNYYIDFLTDKTFIANEAICYEDQIINQPSSGAYDSASLTLSFINCPSMIFTYEISGNNLFIYPPCIEGCGLKYIKISSH